MPTLSNDFWAKTYSNPKGSVESGMLGLEIELEGKLSSACPSSAWKVANEPSLRQCPNGFEYVFVQPMSPDGAEAAINTFDKAAKGWDIKPSIRCSTHIHVSIGTSKNREILSAICLYLLFEEVLVSLQPPERIGNLFCRRASDAEAIPLGLIDMIRTANKSSYPPSSWGWRRFNKEGWRYGALNLAAIPLYGSLEFRFMTAMWRAKDLSLWLNVLRKIVVYGLNNPIDTWLSEYNDLPVKSFMYKILGAHSDDIIANRSSFELNRLMHTNYSHIADILFHYKNRKFTVNEATLRMLDDIQPNLDHQDYYDELAEVAGLKPKPMATLKPTPTLTPTSEWTELGDEGDVELPNW